MTTRFPNQTNSIPPVGRFFEEWIVRQENFLKELISTQENQCSYENGSCEEYFKELVNRLLAHYQEYYDAKSQVAKEDVCFLVSPPWLSSLEQAYIWVAGFKPDTLFKIVNDTILDLSEVQKRSLETLLHKTRVAERKLEDKMAKFQEKVAAPPFYDMAGSYGRIPVNGEIIEDEAMTEVFKSEIRSLVMKADRLRTETTLGVVKIMTSAQNLKFFTAAAQIQLSIRNKGVIMDAAKVEEEE